MQTRGQSWKLTIWTIYDHPTDFPDHFIARSFIMNKPTDDYIVAKSLDCLRIIMANKGLWLLPRERGDDPFVVECWF